MSSIQLLIIHIALDLPLHHLLIHENYRYINAIVECRRSACGSIHSSSDGDS